MALSRIGIVIPAAGKSLRMKRMDKVRAKVLHKPLLYWSVSAFMNISQVVEIVVLVRKQNLAFAQKLVEEESWSSVKLALGGEERQSSVDKGLSFLSPVDLVGIHDGARPCLSIDLVQRGISEIEGWDGAVPVILPTDTVKRVEGDEVKFSFNKGEVFLTQTPQFFRYDALISCYDKIEGEVQDDAILLERQGFRIKAFPGDPENIKVTYPWDLVSASTILRVRQ
jgi:2-C-methyl-D-erythritol 4-phosphate cytidylyltransferase